MTAAEGSFAASIRKGVHAARWDLIDFGARRKYNHHMLNQFSRTELLLGKDATEKLAASRVAVFGLGGVGGYCVEALARAGVGALDLIDSDKFSLTNLNRQLHATVKTLGRYKTDVVAERVAEINPVCVVRTFRTFYLPETAGEFDFRRYDYIVDAIDTVAGKIALVRNAEACKTPIISAMGAGNKLDPTRFEVADLAKTSVCPLARTMRRELKKYGIEHLKVVYSKEEPIRPLPSEEESGKRETPGSVPFVPSVAGLILAGEVVKDLIKKGESR